uniref:C2H2-type domain-containing protein n=1 Tax=Crocodylus porosus TaxID=8502 RepID=A0A7M4FZQ0_CROPO
MLSPPSPPLLPMAWPLGFSCPYPHPSLTLFSPPPESPAVAFPATNKHFKVNLTLGFCVSLCTWETTATTAAPGDEAEAKPHACPECGRRFRQASNLARHRRAHGGERPHACPDCGRCFGRRSNLAQHQRTHSGRPYQCGDCGKAFARAAHLAQHRRVHSGERPYSYPSPPPRAWTLSHKHPGISTGLSCFLGATGGGWQVGAVWRPGGGEGTLGPGADPEGSEWGAG